MSARSPVDPPRPASARALARGAGLVLGAHLLAFVVGGGLGALAVLLSRSSPAAPPVAAPPWTVAAPGAIPGPRAADERPHLARARRLLSEERWGEAHQEFVEAARLAPDDPRPPEGLAQVYRRLHLDELAERAYRRSVELDPEYRPGRLGLAMVLCELGGNEEAIDHLEKLRARDPADPLLAAELAINAVRLGRPTEAVPLLAGYNRAVGRQEWGYANLGRALDDAGERKAAEKAYREAIAIEPRAVLARLWLGQLLVASGRADEARPILERFRKLRGLQTEARNLEQRLGRQSDHVPSLARLARVRMLLGRLEGAVVPLRRALSLAPRDPGLRALERELRRELARRAPTPRGAPPGAGGPD